MDKRSDVFEVECAERNGTVVRTVRFAPLTVDSLRFYWEKLKDFPTLFNQRLFNFESFLSTFVSVVNGELHANGLVWEVDDVGIFWITDVYPGFQASGHFTFWDGKLRGRENLLRQMVAHVMRNCGLHRIIAEVPLYSVATLAFVERSGFKREGRLRKVVRYRDKWWDANLYSVLEEETNGVSQAEGSAGPA